MKNAHERFGVLEYTKRMKDTTTRIQLRLDRFIGEVEDGRNGKAHLISVLGGDSDVGAIWAAVIEQNLFSVEAPGIDSITVSLDDGCPDGANVGVATQNRYEVGLTVPSVFDLSNKPIQPKPDSRGGVLHSLRVFQHPEALVGILHGFLLGFVGFGCGGS